MAWKQVTHDGSTYNIFEQHDLNNCGPSSIAILLKHALGKNVSIGFIQMACGKTEVADGFASGRSANARWHDWGQGGWTIGWTLLHTLQRNWSDLGANEAHGHLNNDLSTNASLAKPAICRVGWRGDNGGHFIVCVGLKNGKLVFLDPYHGLVLIPDAGSNRAVTYSTKVGSFAKGRDVGTITYAVYTDPSSP